MIQKVILGWNKFSCWKKSPNIAVIFLYASLTNMCRWWRAQCAEEPKCDCHLLRRAPTETYSCRGDYYDGDDNDDLWLKWWWRWNLTRVRFWSMLTPFVGNSFLENSPLIGVDHLVNRKNSWSRWSPLNHLIESSWNIFVLEVRYFFNF